MKTIIFIIVEVVIIDSMPCYYARNENNYKNLSEI